MWDRRQKSFTYLQLCSSSTGLSVLDLSPSCSGARGGSCDHGSGTRRRSSFTPAGFESGNPSGSTSCRTLSLPPLLLHCKVKSQAVRSCVISLWLCGGFVESEKISLKVSSGSPQLRLRRCCSLTKGPVFRLGPRTLSHGATYSFPRLPLQGAKEGKKSRRLVCR